MDILSIAVHYGLSKPPSGGQNRFMHIIQELKSHGNNVTVLEPDVFFESGDLERAKIYTYPRYSLFGRSLNLLKDFDIWFFTKLLEIFQRERVDLITIDSPYGAFAVRLAAKLTKIDAPVIYSSHNVEASFTSEVTPQFAELSYVERRMIPRYVATIERLATRHLVDHITAVSDEDSELFRSKYSLDEDKVTVISSGCQLKAPLDQYTRKRARAELRLDSDSIVVVFHGSYSFPPNKEAIDTVTDYVAPRFESDKSVLFVLFGSEVPKFERANVKSFGFVDDLHKALSAADIALVPIRSGSGTKLKFFDYMNAGLPIVTTRKGIEGIRAVNNEHAVIVDDADESMIDSLRFLVQNQRERERLGLNARRLAEKDYSWAVIGNKLENTYRRFGTHRASRKRNI
ncbi:MAG TPA: glycosyltransferase [Candidatus Acidoferrales bacterium]|nr:glycosyltransferase [Candidatus Acidoferrales bacterium]